MDFPSNTRCLDYQNGSYLCDNKIQVEGPLVLETLCEAVRQCPELRQVYLADAPFGDECFPIVAQLAKLKSLGLTQGSRITGHGLSLLKDIPVEQLFLQRTALDDEGIAQAAQIRKLERIYIAGCHQVSFQGLMAVSWRDKLIIADTDEVDEDGRMHRFTQEQWKAFEDARTYKCMKNRLPLDSPELQAPIAALLVFFDEMTRWESLAHEKGFHDPGVQLEIDGLFSRLVSWKPRLGWRPMSLSCQDEGTYKNHRLVVGEQVTKNKFWLYAENDIFYYRYLMRCVDTRWMIDNAQACWAGKWEFCGL